MSVLVKGMEMPDSCNNCPCSKNLVWCFSVAKQGVSEPRCVDHLGLERPDWCPLVEIPERHGRLIDANELSSNMPWIEDEYKYAHELIDNAPTVVEAEGEE